MDTNLTCLITAYLSGPPETSEVNFKKTLKVNGLNLTFYDGFSIGIKFVKCMEMLSEHHSPNSIPQNNIDELENIITSHIIVSYPPD